MRLVVIIEVMLEILENEQELCSVKELSITALTANILLVGNLDATYLKNSKACVDG
jgi:hypothetical protein